MKTLKFLPVVFVLCLVFMYVQSLPLDNPPADIPGHDHNETCGHPFDKLKRGLTKIKDSIKNTIIGAKDAVVGTFKNIKEKIAPKPNENKNQAEDNDNKFPYTPEYDSYYPNSNTNDNTYDTENHGIPEIGKNPYDTGFETWKDTAASKNNYNDSPTEFQHVTTNPDYTPEILTSKETITNPSAPNDEIQGAIDPRSNLR